MLKTSSLDKVKQHSSDFSKDWLDVESYAD